MTPMRLLIVGATGGTDRQLVAQALEAGHDAPAFTRIMIRLLLKDICADTAHFLLSALADPSSVRKTVRVGY